MQARGKMLSSVFGKSFNSGKCKTLLRLAISRIKLLRNKRDMQLKQMRRELGQLLQAKQELTARIRVEHVFREQNIMAAYEIIELFSELLVVRLPIIEAQRQCPIDLREAIASLIFAAPRCADLPELQQISSLFAVKYGKDFVAAAAELRPDCGVNRLVIEKLSVRAPSGEVRLKLMKDIAEEQGVDWDAAASEAEFHKAPEDLLDGPNRYMGSTHVQFQTPIKEPTNSSMAVDFHGALEGDQQNMPFTLPDPPSASKTLPSNAHELGSSELRREESYKDAADAARAAALSAERAAAAAVAVASLAKENYTRMSCDMSKSTSESSSASDDDEYKREIKRQNCPPTNKYFKIRMDSFDAHVNATKSDAFDVYTTRKPLFDDYPEVQGSYARVAHTGATRKQVVTEDFTSDENQSDSTDRSASPPLYRSFKFKDDRESIGEPPCFDSPHKNARIDSDKDELHYNDYERQPSKQKGSSAVHKGGNSRPPQRPPPSLTHDHERYVPCIASHVHPKLPDYDDLSARFEALRSRS